VCFIALQAILSQKIQENVIPCDMAADMRQLRSLQKEVFNQRSVSEYCSH